MSLHTKPNLLAVGVAGLRPQSTAIDIYVASTIREAMATLRLINFDLLVVGLDEHNLDVWELLHRVLTASPQQRWFLTSSYVSTEEEIQARSLGALMVLSEWPGDGWLVELVTSLRGRDRSRGMGRFVQATSMAATAGSVSAVVEAS